MLLKRLNSVFHFGLCGLVAFGAYGLWFLAAITEAMFCPPMPGADIVFPLLIVGLAVFAGSIFWFHTRWMLPKVLEINPQKWDFEKMQYSIMAPTIRPDGKSMKRVTTLMLAGGFLGIFLGALSFREFMADKPTAALIDAWLPMMIGWFVVYVFIGYFAVSKVYSIWIVHKKCKAVGRKMTIKEFSNHACGSAYHKLDCVTSQSTTKKYTGIVLLWISWACLVWFLLGILIIHFEGGHFPSRPGVLGALEFLISFGGFIGPIFAAYCGVLFLIFNQTIFSTFPRDTLRKASIPLLASGLALLWQYFSLVK
ncbi:MAG TPA: hypothetical protein VEG25_12005 [Burkholderiales bacterium]|nr:hypothetical protein [Burkholderiales bacterium]